MNRSFALGTVALVGLLVPAACSSSTSRGGAGGSAGAGPAGSGGSGGVIDPGVCPGVAPWPDGADICHDDAECMYGCSASSDAAGCGACFLPQHQCMIDTDCGMGMVCHAFPFDEPCNCGDETVERRCVPACPSTPCDPGFTCTMVGQCDPTPCDAGYTCPQNTVCAPAAPVDEHGCRPLHCTEGFECPPYDDCLATPSGNGCVPHPCAIDGDCPCGGCVNGQCAGRIGACYWPAA